MTHDPLRAPLKTIRASAPIRVCDNGGWTDTWFAEYGTIFNIAVSPRVYVTIDVFERARTADQVIVDAVNFQERFAVRSLHNREWGPHPLLEAAVFQGGVPDDVAIHVEIQSEAPYGASTGTSAAVCVALLAALDQLTPGRHTPHALAYQAHAVETVLLGQQSGIQDQLAAAYGGINLIEMMDYPQATVKPITLNEDIERELSQRLMLFYLGRPHRSSAVHDMVIQELEDHGPLNPKIQALRNTARPTAEALVAGEWSEMGRLMMVNTEAQRALHPELVSPTADKIASLCKQAGMMGYKVNGAGGDGGSVTVLGNGDLNDQRRFVQMVEESLPGVQQIEVGLSGGVQVEGDDG